MSRTKKKIIIGILVPLGLMILFYPNFSNLWNRHRAELLTTDYEQVVREINTSEKDAILEEARIYNQSLIGTQVPDAFLDRDGVRDPQYEAILNPVGNGLMGQVEIPCIDITLPIYHYTDEEVLQKGAGHLPGSSLPVGGAGSHAVISAHRGLPSAKMFTDLDRVKIGNVFYIHVLGDTLAYEVDQILTVEPSDTEALSVQEGEDYCTLLTCTPYAVNSHRLLVRGHRIPYEEETYQAEAKVVAAPQASSVAMRALCVLAGLAIAAVVVFVIDRIEKKRA